MHEFALGPLNESWSVPGGHQHIGCYKLNINSIIHALKNHNPNSNNNQNFNTNPTLPIVQYAVNIFQNAIMVNVFTVNS